MRILYLTFGQQSGVTKYLIRAFTRKEVEITVLDVSRAVNYRCENHKFPVLMPKNLLNSWLAVRQFGKEWRRYFKFTDFAFKSMSQFASRYLEKKICEYDIIFQAGALFSAAAKPLSKPYVLYLDHTHCISEHYEPLENLPSVVHTTTRWLGMEKETYAKADKIFTMSQNVKKSLVKDYGINANKIETVGAGPNLDKIPDDLRQDYRSNRILFVGENYFAKGGEVLLEAFKIVKKDFPEAGLTIAGCNPKIFESGVTVENWLRKEDLARKYQSASIFVLPTFRESFGIAFLEAMAYKLPCIGTDIEAIPEIIDNGNTGFIIPKGDHNALALKINQLFKNSELMRSMGANGQKKVLERFNWDRVTDIMLSTFQKW